LTIYRDLALPILLSAVDIWFPGRSLVVSGSSKLASKGTHLLKDEKPPLFVFVCMGGPPLCYRRAVFLTSGGSFVFAIFRSCSLLSVRVHLCSSSASFVGAINLAKREVVGDFHLSWIVRALVSWQGGVTH